MTMDYGHGFRVNRERVGLSKRALAKAIGVDPSYITHIEAGRKVPSLEVLVAVAQATGVKPHFVLRDCETDEG